MVTAVSPSSGGLRGWLLLTRVKWHQPSDCWLGTSLAHQQHASCDPVGAHLSHVGVMVRDGIMGSGEIVIETNIKWWFGCLENNFFRRSCTGRYFSAVFLIGLLKESATTNLWDGKVMGLPFSLLVVTSSLLVISWIEIPMGMLWLPVVIIENPVLTTEIPLLPSDGYQVGGFNPY